jgi:hypothetical protein
MIEGTVNLPHGITARPAGKADNAMKNGCTAPVVMKRRKNTLQNKYCYFRLGYV